MKLFRRVSHGIDPFSLRRSLFAACPPSLSLGDRASLLARASERARRTRARGPSCEEPFEEPSPAFYSATFAPPMRTPKPPDTTNEEDEEERQTFPERSSRARFDPTVYSLKRGVPPNRGAAPTPAHCELELLANLFHWLRRQAVAFFPGIRNGTPCAPNATLGAGTCTTLGAPSSAYPFRGYACFRVFLSRLARVSFRFLLIGSLRKIRVAV